MRSAIVFRRATGMALLAALVSISAAHGQDRIKRGEYLAAIMDCGGCHTPGALIGKPDPQRSLAGGDIGFQVPGLGTFYPPNLTSDAETGLGKWSEADIIKAVRAGERPDGRVLAPAMPYHAYSRLTDADARALAAYLKGLKPIRNQAPAMAGESEKPSAPYMTIVAPK